MTAGPEGSRARRVGSVVLLVVSCITFFIGLFAAWAGTTIYDSDAFANRAVAVLDEPEVRRELASRITEQLARAGNQTAVNYRPAMQLAVEAAVDTDSFRSIFRTAVSRTHTAILASQEDGGDPSASALDLSDSISIITANLSLPSNAAPGQSGSGGLNNSFADITKKLSDLQVWSWEDYSGLIAIFGLVAAPVLAGLSVLVAPRRRRAVRRLGWGAVVTGLVVAGLVPVAQLVVGSRISDGPLSRAVSAAVGNVLGDVAVIGLFIAAYGLLLAAATRRAEAGLPTPARVWARFLGWIERRRSTTAGSILVGAIAVLAGAYAVLYVNTVLTALVVAGGFWLSYLGACSLVALVHRTPSDALDALPAPPHQRRNRLLVAAGVGLVVVVLVGIAGVGLTNRAATRAAASGVPECNGDSSLCDVPVNLAMFAGSHNAMSSPLYPGWLFAEQTSTLTGQLDAGIRALLIDTHYGIPSSSRLPGSETTVVITDRAAELASPPGETYDPAIAARAQQIAANAPVAAATERSIYLCHNFCEMGAASFTSEMAKVRTWLDTHPDEVVMMIVEDHTTPADTAAALVAAGIADKAWTLDANQPIPSMGDLVRSGRNLLVFAENGGPGSPAWYQSAYQWFQETPYAWKTVDAMDCGPNRGADGNTFMLINHWVGYSPPDPGKAGSLVNTSEVLQRRIEQCISERGVWPNIVAVDFAERGDLVKVVGAYNAEVKSRLSELGGKGSSGTTTTVAGSSTSTTLPVASASGAAIRQPTVITGLTGGDPVAFCRAVTPWVQTMAGWSLAELSAPPAATGLPSLLFGPLVDRQMPAVMASAPDELAVQFTAAQRQAAAAVQALRDAGLTQAQIDTLADAMADQFASDHPDAAAAAVRVDDLLKGMLGADRKTALATSFGQTNPLDPAVFDLGDVSDQVASDSGYACLVVG
jgi:hypothetical protein